MWNIIKLTQINPRKKFHNFLLNTYISSWTELKPYINVLLMIFQSVIITNIKERTLPSALIACSTLFLENPISISWRTKGAGEVARVRLPLGVCAGRDGRGWFVWVLFRAPTGVGPPRE